MAESIIKIINDNIRMQLDHEKICAIWWWHDSKNWGDALSPILIEYLSKKKPMKITKHILNLKNEPIFTAIGSILQLPIFTKTILKNTYIWGTGFVNRTGRLQSSPKKVCAVRGPRTRENLLKSGIKCPEIYGDPALLYPMIYKPEIPKKYKLGIIPHFVDKENILMKAFKDNSEIKIIDIEGQINSVVDEICSCKYIASSSLHGIIAADAYRIPSIWIKISNEVMGDGFKFRDYFESVGRSDKDPLTICATTTLDTIYDEFYNYKIDIDLNALLDACPFYHRKICN